MSLYMTTAMWRMWFSSSTFDSSELRRGTESCAGHLQSRTCSRKPTEMVHYKCTCYHATTTYKLRKKSKKSFPSYMAHGMELTSDSSALSQKLQDYRRENGVPVYLSANAGTKLYCLVTCAHGLPRAVLDSSTNLPTAVLQQCSDGDNFNAITRVKSSTLWATLMNYQHSSMTPPPPASSSLSSSSCLICLE